MRRDPIGEDGGYNLYVFLKNSPVKEIDFYGTKTVPYLFISKFSIEVGVVDFTLLIGGGKSRLIKWIENGYTGYGIIQAVKGRRLLYQHVEYTDVPDCYVSKVVRDDIRDVEFHLGEGSGDSYFGNLISVYIFYFRVVEFGWEKGPCCD